MKQVSQELAQHLSQPVTTLSRILLIKRADCVVIALTDHDEDIDYDSNVEPA